MGVLDKRQPSFPQFMEHLLATIKQVTGQQVDAYTPWLEVGERSDRAKILEEIKKHINNEYDFEPVIDEQLLELDSPVESIANQVHHVISTMYIVERINAKKRLALQNNPFGGQ